VTERKVSRGLIVMIVVVFGLLLAEALLVAFVFVSPSASERLGGVAASIQRTWDGTETDPGVRTDVATAFHRGYQYWIVPLWSSPEAPPGEPGFAECVECHPDYAAKRKFTVFLNHPLHAQSGVACATCHRQNVHPNPPRPQELTCAECHREVNQENGCGFCHPPASLPHFYLLGAPREGVVDCDTCHQRGRFDTDPTEPLVHADRLDGTDRSTCLTCHEEPSCRGCHGAPHPSSWPSEHGAQLFVGGVATCYSCHTQTWCADRCHAVTSTVPFVPRPIPQVGVRP
jgi:hypothetical protein